MAKKGRRATNEERLAAIQMYDNGLTADQIAEILNVGRSSVFDWSLEISCGWAFLDIHKIRHRSPDRAG
jgi:transposase-like protein